MSVLLQFWAVSGREEQRAEEKRAGDALFIFVLLLFSTVSAWRRIGIKTSDPLAYGILTLLPF